MRPLGFLLSLSLLLGLALSATPAAGSTTGLRPPTSTAPVVRERAPRPTPRLVDIRVGRHQTFDRVVFDFDGPLPGYTVRYVRRVTQGGSGATVPLAGRAFLGVDFTPAHAHDDAGNPTYPGPRRLRPQLVSLEEIAFHTDFEAHVGVGIGLSDRVGFRVLELRDPTRVAIDVAHLPPLLTSDPKTRERAPRPTPELVGIRVGHHALFDRLVLDFRGPRPGFDVRYGPVVDPAGRRVRLEGQADLQVIVQPAVAHDERGNPTYTGPRTITTGFPSLRQVKFVSDFEAQLLIGVGLDDVVGFRVFTLTDGTRLVLDVAG